MDIGYQGSKNHAVCIQHAIEEGLIGLRNCEKGFFDSEGEFQNRTEAFKIAKKAGQLSLTTTGPKLYSHNLKEWEL